MTTPLTEVIRREIAAQGPMTFRRFMEQALYHPEHGYYAAGKAAIGREGDYFTNVSVGPLFGRLLASQFREMWEWLDRPEEFTIIEQGAHSGIFAHDVLTATDTEFRAALRYVIIEPFPALRERQRKTLEGLREVSWSESADTLEPLAGVHFSNELLDAMPVHLVVFRNGEWRERYVDGALAFIDGPLSSDALRAHLAHVAPPAIEGYQTEVNLDALEWLDGISAKITRGFLLAIDYGYDRESYYQPERNAGTLSCYERHRRSDDPLRDPGEIDITAHVEFTSLAERAQRLGWRIAGFTDQHHFLVGLGETYFEKHIPDGQSLRAFKTLMHPTMLGTSFQVFALAKDVSRPGTLRGFRYGRGKLRVDG